ncbi:hypothetical protein MGMO_131c00030 [Methyloglobulus morosus KoM1]|uniref:Uncharacterized protein n=1 Tax=Methyloglobulus morosus KoM1 TaxID=1116472 RepID=V5DQ88_9GAMM|nr:hypothetical protein [Methyloglobulus morosus]ESS69561.1 hypothetical protein MGMO_131c00030 [Methyloglobulus morosus KoM1]
MFKAIFIAPLLALAMSFQQAHADDTSIALQETQDCLRKQNCSSATTDAGKAADRKVLDALGGDASIKQELYGISADILPILVQQAGGDTTKMLAILEKAQNNPEDFLKLLPLELQNRIKIVATGLDKDQALKGGKKF